MDFVYQPPTQAAHEFVEGFCRLAGTGPFEGVFIRTQPWMGDVVEVRNIGVEGERGTGRGSRALEALFDLADGHGVDLLIQPDGKDPELTKRLDAWYRRMGCVDSGEEGRLAYRAGSRESLPSP